MNIIRPITPNDLDTLATIAKQSGPGFTSLPHNPELLEQRIERSISSLKQEVSIAGEQSYLFVLEDTEQQKVIGTCGIEAAVGTRDPWYHYRIGTIVHASRELQVHNRFKTLYLCNDYTGHSEVCTLYLDPEYRHSKNGTLLSKSRFMFMAEYPERFNHRVIAEMRGVSNDSGVSPFWEGLGKRFFSMEFSEADYLTGIGNKSFIAELMPKHSIYIHLLPPSAQSVIGQVHTNTQPARKILEDEGFRFEGYIDIFDGGPTLVSKVSDVRSIRHSRYYKVRVTTSEQAPQLCLASNTSLEDFRCTLAPLPIEPQGSVFLTPLQADALRVKEGGSLRVRILQ
ncbi:MAG: arginine N-succinyltransferase [Motiliproteus sp.]